MKTEYAIVDIETTGGYASGGGITEIAVLVHDGQEIIHRYETLINPQRSIPVYIQSLTGIDNDMVADSPIFKEVAKDIYELLQGRIFVAHSVNFDYSFLKHHLMLEGYDLNAPKVCTVRLSRKVKPGLPSYSLGRLCGSLGIPLENRHRAGGDAEATAILFERLLSSDTEGHLKAMLRKGSGEQTLPPNVSRQDFERLPLKPGVYYFRDKGGKVVYVGKALNLKKRVASHFTGHNTDARRQDFLRDIFSIDFELCGTELMALLLEAVEIGRLWPKYNRALKRQEPRFGLYCYEDLLGYQRLAIGKHNKFQPGIQLFHREEEGRNMLHQLVRNFGLCPAYCGLGTCSGDCHITEDATSVCLAEISTEQYNLQVQLALRQYAEQMSTFAIIDKGRHQDEQSIIWVERDQFYGMGYLSHDTDLNTPEDIRNSLARYNSNHYMMQLIRNFAQQQPGKIMKVKEDTFVMTEA